MKIDKSLLSGTTVLLVLSLLQQEDQYGYQMIAALSARSDNVFQMKEGTLYPVLHTLEKQGHIKSYEKETPSGPEAEILPADGQRTAAAGRKSRRVEGIFPGGGAGGDRLHAPASAGKGVEGREYHGKAGVCKVLRCCL